VCARTVRVVRVLDNNARVGSAGMVVVSAALGDLLEPGEISNRLSIDFH